MHLRRIKLSIQYIIYTYIILGFGVRGRGGRGEESVQLKKINKHREGRGAIFFLSFPPSNFCYFPGPPLVDVGFSVIFFSFAHVPRVPPFSPLPHPPTHTPGTDGARGICHSSSKQQRQRQRWQTIPLG